MRLTVLAVFAGALAASGCTTNPYTGESQVSKAAYGAGIGALAGCAVGAAVKSKGGCGKGALVGAGAGAGVGVYMDVQEKKLRDRLAGVGVGIQRDKATGAINLVMPGNITFPTAQSAIKADFYPVLDAVADVLKEYGDTTITVSGHTDNVGDTAYNQRLSQERANSVAGYLVNRGVSAQRVAAIGLGKSQPIADNGNEAGRSQNRRVEVRINPPQQ